MFEQEHVCDQQLHDDHHSQFMASTDNPARDRLVELHEEAFGKDHWSYLHRSRHWSPLPSPYFGSQGRYIGPLMKFLRLHYPDMQQISDATSGSNAPMYIAKQSGLCVRTNDRCYMSHVVSRAVVTVESEPEQMVDLRTVPAILVEGGYVGSLSLFPDDVAGFMDHAVLAAAHVHDFLMLAAIAGTLVSSYTFRGMGFDKNLCRDAKLTMFITQLQRRIERLKKAILRDVPAGEAFNLNAEEFVQLPGQHDTLYMDFAWPWHDGTPVVTYDFFSRDISSILLQRDLGKFPFTTGKDILGKILSIWRDALEHYNRLILSTQTTNYPPPEMMQSALEEEFGDQCKYATYYDVVSQQSSKPFRELVYVIER